MSLAVIALLIGLHFVGADRIDPPRFFPRGDNSVPADDTAGKPASKIDPAADKIPELERREAPAAFEYIRMAKQAPEGSHRKIGYLQEAIRIDPSCFEAHYLLGNAYCRIGMSYRYVEWYDKAVAEYRKAAELSPDSARAFCGLGEAYMLRGRYRLAKESMGRALQLDPGMKTAKSCLDRLKNMGY